MQELARILGTLPARGQRRDEARTALARAVWARVAGGPIAAHSRVLVVRRGSLRLEADGAQWAEAISGSAASLVENLHKSYPALGLKRIQVEVGLLREHQFGCLFGRRLRRVVCLCPSRLIF